VRAVWPGKDKKRGKDKQGGQNTPAAPPVPEAPKLPKPAKGKDKPAKPDTGKNRGKSTTGGKTPMGAISDAADALMAAITKADITSARNLEAVLKELTVFDTGVAQVKQRFANRISDEFPADPGISDMVHRQSAQHSKFATDGREVQNALRKHHQHEWERLDNPRTNENAWDHDRNNQA